MTAGIDLWCPFCRKLRHYVRNAARGWHCTTCEREPDVLTRRELEKGGYLPLRKGQSVVV